MQFAQKNGNDIFAGQWQPAAGLFFLKTAKLAKLLQSSGVKNGVGGRVFPFSPWTAGSGAALDLACGQAQSRNLRFTG